MKATNKNTAKNKTYNVTMSEMLFPVQVVQTPYAESNSDCAFDVVAEINGVQRKLQSCSDVYVLQHNKEIFPVIENSLKDNNIAFSALYSHTNYSKFYAQYRLFNEGFKVGNENLNVVISVIHSYDGWLTYSFFSGLVGTSKPQYRKSIPCLDKNFIRVGKHTKKSLGASLDFFERVEEITAKKDEIFNALSLLVNTEVSKPTELVEKVMKATNIADGAGKDMGKNKKAILSLALSAKTKWDVYNAINEGYIYSTLNSWNADKRAKLDLDVMNYLL